MDDPIRSANRLEAIEKLAVFSTSPSALTTQTKEKDEAKAEDQGKKKSTKKSKDKERRKSIIQMVQGLFHRSEKDKKDESPTVQSPQPCRDDKTANEKQQKIKSPKLKERPSPFRIKAKGKQKVSC